MGGEEQSLHKRIQHLQSMLGEINKYLQAAPAKPAGMVSRLLEEKARITGQLRELNNVMVGKAAESEKQTKGFLGLGGALPGGEKEKENPPAEDGAVDPLERRTTLEEVLQEMNIEAAIDEHTRRLILSGADIFLDNLIATACSIARNRGADELSKEDLLFSMKMERKIEMYNTCVYEKQREPDKEHLKRLQLIRRDQKRANPK